MQLSFFDLWNKSQRLVKRSLTFRDAVSRKPTKRRTRVKTSKQSDPLLLSIWQDLQAEYFPDIAVLDSYRIYWSNRPQKRTLASCNIIDRKVNVARELNYPEYHHWLHPLVYHEMCHAALGEHVPVKNGKRQWHGEDFKALENQHPLMKEFDRWIKSGGWQTCVRSDRGKRAYQKRKKAA